MHHQKTCLFKTTGKRSAEDVTTTSKKLKKDNVNYVGGALENTLADYRINLEDESQDDPFAVLKDSVHQLRNKISEELANKRAIKLYISLHAQFRLDSDPTFITQPPPVLNTETTEIFESSNIPETLDAVYNNLVTKIENFQQTGSGFVLDKLLMLDLYIFTATCYIIHSTPRRAAK